MVEHEYMQLIAEQELQVINSLLRKVSRLRGWRGGTSSFEAAWLRVLEAASTEGGGMWCHQFEPADMRADALTSFMYTIDDVLLGGLLRAHCSPQRETDTARCSPSCQDGAGGGATAAGGGATAAGGGATAAVEARAHKRSTQPRGGKTPSSRPPLRCGVVERCLEEDDWLSYFGDDNVVMFNGHRWRQVVTEQLPLSCEGVFCTSKLQVLAHTLGHELVHALVLNLWPEIDKASAAYLPDERHGPIFKLLNARLMGHVSNSYRPMFEEQLPMPTA